MNVAFHRKGLLRRYGVVSASLKGSTMAILPVEMVHGDVIDHDTEHHHILKTRMAVG